VRVIQTREDIEYLRAAGVLPAPYLDLVEGDFDRVAVGTGPGAYSPQSEGYFVILERGDNLKNLEVVGLDPGAGGLLGCAPEAVDIHEPAPGLKIYQVLVAYNNSCLMSFYLEQSLVGDRARARLEENLIRREPGAQASKATGLPF